MEEIRDLKKIAELRKQEEQFWESRSRVKWLRSGDKNTRFFHATTMQRRSVNRIARIKLSNGDWEIDEDRIMEASSNLFTSSNPHDPSPLLVGFPVKISEDMNSLLV
ncbi:reverse transcriptase [Senna tora]|uniref:Reverse transcriptase n=1 Tax=Senna tora TaxID=362788 RepID=A0A835CIA1_9FABA|nr:reverse transcriptase [Senna tora]